ncbi:MAG: hypothetical protein A2V88_04345 [Elusimicrobia bacterium RBG_16_66_12]|nr:MAG: hypothetical protein A2V88_04345 [Elusimicrobia bacterium RBG_16_66_12]
MTSVAIARALWTMARRILIRIGGWVAAELLAWGASRLAVYMRIRAGALARRSTEARRARLRARLRARARRWVAAAAWLEERAADISDRVAEAWIELAESERIPLRSLQER